MVNHPRVFCVACLLAMWLMARLGFWLGGRFRVSQEQGDGNLGLVVPATLTLLGLIIGFTFSMATTRYDQRKLFEEGEANAIGTEYVRADLLPAAEGTEVRGLLVAYLHHRIDYYRSDYGDSLHTLDQESARFEARLWRSVEPAAAAAPNPVTALAVSGMNDVLNSAGYTQFSWWNRIPTTAWGLMVVIALFANGLVGYATRRSRDGALLLLVLPLIVAVSFFLIGDIDSPRGGIIRVDPVHRSDSASGGICAVYRRSNTRK